ncbi:alpha-glucosidase precursor [Penicillium angulare]|uniref:alpha-glucosidase n=1 Tax=Penicillium angulare TaxID=116970 RepID=A0A9W9KJF5_9EURO|nr:alpha-glucosidase precursor [Penicillium angulare]
MCIPPTWRRVLSGLSLAWVVAQAHTPSASTTSSAQYTLPASVNEAPGVIPNIKDPQAVNAQTICPGYIASNVQKTNSGLTASLTLAGEACNLYGTDVESLNLTIEYQTTDRLNVAIAPTYISAANETQYFIPPSVAAKPEVEESNLVSDLEFSWSNDPSFAFEVTRKSTEDVIFSTKGRKLVFENQFVEFSSALPEEYNLYGLGESIHAFRLGNNYTKTYYAADDGATVDVNIYGTHPFYLETRYFTESDDGNHTLVTANETMPDGNYTSQSHGVYSRNAHGQDILLQAGGITYRAIGGSIDLYFFAGPTQPKVTTSYLKAVGLPAMQQYWTFGFHQCRWGYKSWQELEDVVGNYTQFGIPLETIWTDIDWMLRYRDFENNPIGFGDAPGQKFLQRLHDGGRHYVPIFDSAIYVPNPTDSSDAYPVFERGNDTGSFLKNPDGSLYIGDVWPGFTVFPDWLSDGAVPWWTDEMVRYHNITPFDGAWIDMSEISSFCVGSCGSGHLDQNPVHPPFALPGEPSNLVLNYPEGFNKTNATEAASASSALASSSSAYPASTSTDTSIIRTTPTPGIRNVNYPPYAINNVQGALDVSAISPNATHADGTLEYEMHNLWGHGILKATYTALSAVFPDLRPFIIGRSTFSGSGAFAGHWGGDNWSNWPSMIFSIPQALEMSLLGIPMFGVDTCGFADNTDMELCNRWMQLSAFFPFYRNHNTLSAISQEAYRWDSVIDASKSAMAIRFQLLPYLYTLFYHAHTKGHTVMRALAWEFPNDPSLASADRQFLLGPSILVIPVLEPSAKSVEGVFPGLTQGQETWYDWYNHTAVSVSSRANTTIDAPLGHIPVYVRGGSVLPLQQRALTTRDARNTPWDILVALDKNGDGDGDLYLDDGISVQPNATLTANLTVHNRRLDAVINHGGWVDGNVLRNVTIWGIENTDNKVKFNGHHVHQGNVQFDKIKKTLVVSGFNTSAWAGDRWTLEW